MDDLTMTARGLPAGNPAILFHGAAPASRIFGDGFLLVDASAGVRRYASVVASADGQADWGPGVFGASGLTAGQTLWFQAWYMSPSGPCGSGSNMTNALRVNFDS
ncbi:MAG: hypothetical protein ACI841_001871 [Planctomycetota bacterium]|jgi:hypothetical protein